MAAEAWQGRRQRITEVASRVRYPRQIPRYDLVFGSSISKLPANFLKIKSRVVFADFSTSLAGHRNWPLHRWRLGAEVTRWS